MTFLKILLAICLLILKQTAWAGPAEEVYSKFADNIVTLDTYDRVLIQTRQGSGVVIDRGTGNGFEGVLLGPWILTNYHVIERAGLIVATSRNGTRSNAWVIFFDRDRDIALIQTHTALKFSKISAGADCKVGNEIFTIGAPEGLGWTISNGIISSLRRKAEADVVQFTAPISPGSSGGGLFAATGDLLGITSFRANEGQNLNFAFRITPEFLTSLARFRERGAAHPVGVNEGDWNAGYHEPGTSLDFKKALDDPNARPAWWLDKKQMRLWDAHLQVIEKIEKRVAEVEHAMSASEQSAAFKELDNRDEIAGELKYPINRIKRECDQAYARRFHDFPDDVEGWAQEFDPEADRRASIDSLRQAMERWPSDIRVIREALSITLFSPADLPEAYRVNQSQTETLFHHIEQIVERLPSREGLDAMFQPFKGSGLFERTAGDFAIRQLAGEIDFKLKVFGGPTSLQQRKKKLRDQLRDKGWIKPDK